MKKTGKIIPAAPTNPSTAAQGTEPEHLHGGDYARVDELAKTVKQGQRETKARSEKLAQPGVYEVSE